MKPSEDAYKPAVAFVVMGSICLALAIRFAIWPLYGFACFCCFVAIVIMLEKIAANGKGPRKASTTKAEGE